MNIRKFENALNRYSDMSEMEAASLEGRKIWAEIVDNAPVELLRQFVSDAVEKGELPPPIRYTESGEPVFSTAALAEHFRVTVAEIENATGATGGRGDLLH